MTFIEVVKFLTACSTQAEAEVSWEVQHCVKNTNSPVRIRMTLLPDDQLRQGQMA